MAGIGFELRKLLRDETYFGLFRAYAYAGVISAGPWILSIIGVLFIGLFSISVVIPTFLIIQFQVSVTYLLAFSLIFAGFLQLAFTRYIADRLFEKEDGAVLPNFHGVVFIVTIVSGGVGLVFAVLAFPDQTVFYRLLMAVTFVVLCNIWMATVYLSGMKQYKLILAMFALGYSITVGTALLLRPFGLEGLLSGFLLGQFVLLSGMMILTIRHFPSERFISFDFLRRDRIYLSLVWSGFFYNFAIWADKIVFWFSPDTSQPVIGPLRASLIYDLPIFIAYLSILPGMAVFLVRMETDFVEYYKKFYDAVRGGEPLDYIHAMRDEMAYTVRQGVLEIIKVQGIAMLVIIIAAPAILRWAGIPDLYLNLLYVDAVAVGLQVVFLGLLNVMFYLDKRILVFKLTALFLVSNILFSWFSLYLGPDFYGYGFAFSLLVSVLAAMRALDEKIEKLEYETFMLQ